MHTLVDMITGWGAKTERQAYSQEDKYKLLAEFESSKQTAVEFAKNHSIKPRTMQGWVKRDEDGLQLQATSGRPRYLTPTAERYIIDQIQVAKENEHTQIRQEMKTTIIAGINKGLEERKQAPIVKTISPPTLKKIKDAVGIKKRMAQSTTEQRQEAQRDLRNYVSVAAMFKVGSEDKDPSMVGNMDATTYVLNNNDTLVYYIPKEGDDDQVARVANGGLSVLVKFVFLHNAKGAVGEFLCIIADKKMEAEDFRVAEIPGFSHVQSPTAKGFIGMAKSRQGNPKMVQWIIENLVVPFVQHNRSNLHSTRIEELKDGDWAFMTLDGELSQLNGFLEPDMIELFAKNRIQTGKLPAATTGTTQASDKSKLFMASKKIVKFLEDYQWENPNLEAQLEEGIKNGLKASYTADKRHKMVNALLKIKAAAQQALTTSIITTAYRKIGLFPLSLEMTLSQCRDKSKLSAQV